MNIRLGLVLLAGMIVGVAGCASSSSPSAQSTGSLSSAPGASGAGPAASPQAAGPGSCASANLQVKLGASQGTAGSVVMPIDFTNTGGTSCTLYGYPGVSLAAGGAQVGAAAVRDTVMIPAKLVTLAPGATAFANLQISQAGNYQPAACQPKPVTTLVVYPPNQTVSVSLPYRTTGCAATGLTILDVTVVQAGAAG
jgi:hypothetical protein